MIKSARFGLLAALPLLVAGCATAHAEPPSSAPSAVGVAPTSSASTTRRGGGPSEAAAMICGAEIQQSVATLLGLPKPPPSASSMTGGLFTCTYRLSTGPLVMSVQESGTPAAARSYFEGLRRQLGSTTRLTGLDSLGLPAFETSDGVVSFVKDDKTLEVDPRQLPAQGNPGNRTRSDIAYTLATDVLGCWNGG